jgi:hypothetical protein
LWEHLLAAIESHQHEKASTAFHEDFKSRQGPYVDDVKSLAFGKDGYQLKEHGSRRILSTSQLHYIHMQYDPHQRSPRARN